MKYIKIFATGGTFDKEFNELSGELFFKNTQIYNLLELGRCKLDIKIEPLMLVDSLKMDDAERDYIVQKCTTERTDKIVITHGTDTMVKTAESIARVSSDKTIILTGAMIPIKFGSSDGLFNLGSALSFVQVLDNGVYVAMNGRYFNWNDVKKNKKIGVFEKIL